MEKRIEYATYKFTDWSKHLHLTEQQRKQLIAEKLERARIQSLAMQRSPYKVIQ
jgi:hypothetical protein